MYYERNYGGQWGASDVGEWKEWMLAARSFAKGFQRDYERKQLLAIQQEGDGTVWAYNESVFWPDGVGRHDIVSTSHFISGSYRYFMSTGDADFLKLQIERLRKGINRLLSFYDSTSQILINKNMNHTGQAGSFASNYWDYVPYGYKDAYANISAYNALRRMAQLEAIVGNSTRNTELNTYANNIKTGYNNVFWNGNVYVQ